MAAILATFAVLAASAVQSERAEAANTVTVKGCTGTNVILKTAEKRMLDLHNKTRANRGLSRLCVHPALQKAARAHSRDMIDRDYFSHNTKGSGKTFATRIKEAGYRARTAGENLAWGSGAAGSPEETFNVDNPKIDGTDNWMDSPGHRANVLNSRFREIGIGSHVGTFRYNGRDYSNVTMWTADFGAR